MAESSLIDEPELEKMLRAMERQAASGKPYDRLASRFDKLLAQSAARVALRGPAVAPRYDDQLPISQKREQILALLAKHQVLVLAGETGSGKTTQLPKLCLELGRGRRGLIGHTQPRRLAARAVAARIAEELGTELGGLVGYQVRFTDQVGDSTRVKLMTDGILLAEIQHDPLLRRYDTLIIDEAHERSLNIDFLLGYLKRLLPRRPDLKLIITSATIDLERFSRHFGDAPILEVSGRTYPVEVLYRPLDELQAEQGGELDQAAAVLAAIKELEVLERQRSRSGRGDVLVFLSGEREIRETAEVLRRAQLRDTEVLPLYARLSNAEQNRIFHPSGQGRRIVLATNVAETSLTVPGIRYVVDPGFARISRYSYRSKVQRLPVEPISRASANQRKGRCGRVAEGICIRLYSEEDFNNRPAFTDAEILRTNLASVILQMAAQNLGAMADFPFIDPPDPRQIKDGVRLLEELGAMHGGKLTRLGQQLARLPVDPRLGRMLLEAERNGSLRELLVLAAVLGIQDPRERPLEKQTQADQCHAEYRDDLSDFVTLLNLWQRFEEQRQELSQNQLRKQCQKQFLSYLRMREWRDLHRQLLLACKAMGLKQNAEPASYAAIHQALLSGLLGQIGFRQENREYLGARNRKFLVFPGSPLSKGKQKWIVAAELVETSRLYARLVARIEPEWVEKLAGHLVRRSYSEPHWEKKRGDVVANEQISLYGLVIVPRRKVSFGRIEPDTAQQIFIRSALVEGEYDTQAPFFSHNRDLLAEVAALEDKSRRRDILIDEEQLYEFYRELLLKNGGESVVNGASFEQWRKKVEATSPQLLFLDKAYLMRHDAQTITGTQYPDTLTHEGLRFKLDYHFEPGSDDDGVSVNVPAAALKRLPVERLEWLVPGLVEEKCIALLKQLPKALRKNFVPVPDYARAFLQSQPVEAKSLVEQLSRWLRRKTGVQVPDDAWQSERLEPHLRFNIRVLDAHGRVVGQGRSWEELLARFGDSCDEEAVADPGRQRWEVAVEGVDFEPLPTEVELHQAGMSVPAYPGLSVEKEGLWVRLFDHPAAAMRSHRQGLVCLLERREQTRLKELRRGQRVFESCALRLGAVVAKERLWQDLAQCALINSYIKEGCALPRSGTELEQAIAQGRGELAAQFEAALGLLDRIATHYQVLGKKLKGQVQLAWVPVLNDIRAQLEQLVYPGFMAATPTRWLARYPVYLHAIDYRLQRFKTDLQRQRLQSDELRQGWERFAVQRRQIAALGGDDAELQQYRWMLEEYRVSLFAQQLGTEMPVSAKRLAEQWRRCGP
nr:ATP-dependent RNA helicase HrpA [Motiliproteus sediminis]